MLSKTEKAVRVIRILEREIPKLNPPIHLMFETQQRDPYKILVCGILSARSRDEKTVEVCRKLFEKYPTPSALLKAPTGEIEEALKGIGLYRQKAKYLKLAIEKLIKEYHGKLPKSLKELVKFPGVGRKIANVILLHAFGEDTIPVDTHVHRIANRLGLVNNTKTPEQTEEQLKKVVPTDLWKKVNYLLVGLGQTICTPQAPKCEICPVKDLCDYYKKRNDTVNNT